jgi:hypothetical protein
VAARKNGIYGGQERASRYEHVILSEWASWRGKAVLERYGPEYFKELRKRRKHYPKYSESPVIQTSPRVLAGKTMAEKLRTHCSRGYHAQDTGPDKRGSHSTRENRKELGDSGTLESRRGNVGAVTLGDRGFPPARTGKKRFRRGLALRDMW